MTDFKYAGDGQQGMNDIYLVGARAFEMVLLELGYWNQAFLERSDIPIRHNA